MLRPYIANGHYMANGHGEWSMANGLGEWHLYGEWPWRMLMANDIYMANGIYMVNAYGEWPLYIANGRTLRTR